MRTVTALSAFENLKAALGESPSHIHSESLRRLLGALVLAPGGPEAAEGGPGVDATAVPHVPTQEGVLEQRLGGHSEHEAVCAAGRSHEDALSTPGNDHIACATNGNPGRKPAGDFQMASSDAAVSAKFVQGGKVAVDAGLLLQQWISQRGALEKSMEQLHQAMENVLAAGGSALHGMENGGHLPDGADGEPAVHSLRAAVRSWVDGKLAGGGPSMDPVGGAHHLGPPPGGQAQNAVEDGASNHPGHVEEIVAELRFSRALLSKTYADFLAAADAQHHAVAALGTPLLDSGRWRPAFKSS